jgi:virginiamycin B lyase
MKYQRQLGIVRVLGSCMSFFVLALGVASSASAADVVIKSWAAPTASHYLHDAMVSRDGSIWYAARNSNTLGRFDPVSETWQEYVTDIADSGPHGLKEDDDGNIWFTAIGATPTYIGMLDPRTSEFTEYPVTLDIHSPNEKKPSTAHSLILDDRGYAWFTMIGADMLGRLDRNTGEIRLGRSPLPDVGVYSVELDSEQVPWFSLFRTNLIVRVEPESMDVTSYAAPWPEARPRRIAISHDDAIWYTDFRRGRLGRFDPNSETWSEWPSPGGEWSRPYGMVAVGDVIWYSESWKDPSRLVRFDSKTEEFQSWPVDDCLDGAYNIVADDEGDLWFVCHDTDRLVKVETGDL